VALISIGKRAFLMHTHVSVIIFVFITSCVFLLCVV
jgi:hypothetical protein